MKQLNELFDKLYQFSDEKLQYLKSKDLGFINKYKDLGLNGVFNYLKFLDYLDFLNKDNHTKEEKEEIFNTEIMNFKTLKKEKRELFLNELTIKDFLKYRIYGLNFIEEILTREFKKISFNEISKLGDKEQQIRKLFKGYSTILNEYKELLLRTNIKILYDNRNLKIGTIIHKLLVDDFIENIENQNKQDVIEMFFPRFNNFNDYTIEVLNKLSNKEILNYYGYPVYIVVLLYDFDLYQKTINKKEHTREEKEEILTNEFGAQFNLMNNENREFILNCGVDINEIVKIGNENGFNNVIQIISDNKINELINKKEHTREEKEEILNYKIPYFSMLASEKKDELLKKDISELKEFFDKDITGKSIIRTLKENQFKEILNKENHTIDEKEYILRELFPYHFAGLNEESKNILFNSDIKEIIKFSEEFKGEYLFRSFILKKKGYQVFNDGTIILNCGCRVEIDLLILKRISDLKEGAYCGTCVPKGSYSTSNSEKEIGDYIESIYKGEIIRNARIIETKSSKRRREIDIYAPELNIGIEYNGNFLHNNDESRSKEKYDSFDGKLIVIWEDQWKNKRIQIEHRLNFLFGNMEKIHARKCEIKEIDSSSKNIFLERYHLMGKDNSTIKLGAFHDGELVGVMTFSKPNYAKGGGDFDYELSRFATKYQVNGLGSKFMKFMNDNYEFNEIKTFSDNQWGNGKVYEQMGFEYDGETGIGYFYVDKNLNRYHRYNKRKQILLEEVKVSDIFVKGKSIEDISKEYTEKQLAELLGYFICYDLGNKIFSYKKKRN